MKKANETPAAVSPDRFRTRQFALGIIAGGLLVLAITVVGGIVSRPPEALSQTPTETPTPQPYVATVLEPPVDTLDFTLQDQRGKTVQWGEYRGQIVVLAFLYTSCPDTCPQVARKLSQVYTALGIDVKKVTFVAITVDPERDTPAAIQAFSDKSVMTGRWDFLTGSPDALSPLWQAYVVEDIRKEATSGASNGTDANHSSRVHIIDMQGKDRLVYGAAFNARDMTRDIRKLLNEA